MSSHHIENLQFQEPAGSELTFAPFTGQADLPQYPRMTAPETVAEHTRTWDTPSGYPNDDLAATLLTEAENDATDLDHSYLHPQKIPTWLGQTALPSVKAEAPLTTRVHHSKAA